MTTFPHALRPARLVRTAVTSALLLALSPLAQAHQDAAAPGYKARWSERQVDEVLDKTLTLRLAPALDHLSDAEARTLNLLLQAGGLIHDIYLQAQHKDALAGKAALEADPAKGRNGDLLKLYRIFKGPIATTLDNRREPFIDVAGNEPGKNRYPWGIDKAAIEQVLAEYPSLRPQLLHPRSVVRATGKANLERDLATLERHPVLAVMHPGLARQLSALRDNRQPSLYAVPYAVAYADRIMKIYHLLHLASDTIAAEDSDFADYLQLRARDLLTDNYEAGDASWITGRFNNINAQIGAYETYDDGLYGTKASFSMSLLVKDQQRSRELRAAITDLQALEDSLPYANHKKVSSDIPIGVYNVVADFGQSRGTNTASILPNESHITRKYGRTILLRYNIMTNQAIFDAGKTQWDAVMAAPFDDDLTLQSNFQRTLWHEIGHYMGPSVDKQGRTLDIALENNSNLLEEMKSDLVSLYAAAHLRGTGYHTDDSLRAVYAGGIKRVLQKVKPRRSQSYQTMQLMTMNYFLEQQVLRFDADKVELHIDYGRYPAAVKSLLTKLLDIQYQGDKAASDAFIERYSQWEKQLHGRLATKMRDTRTPRYRQVKYAALGE